MKFKKLKVKKQKEVKVNQDQEKKKLSKEDIAHIVVTILITIGFCLLGYFVYKISYIRLWESVKDFGDSIRFYFFRIIGIPIDDANVIYESNVMDNDIQMGNTFEVFKADFIRYFGLFFNKDNLLEFFHNFAGGLGKFSKVVLMLLPVPFLIWILSLFIGKKTNNRHNKDTLPMKIFRLLTTYVYSPIKDRVKKYYSYLRDEKNKWILILWLIIWCCNLNIASIFIEIFAYYLYFAVSYDFANLYTQFRKLIVDLRIVIEKLPKFILIIVAYLGFDRMRKKAALRTLLILENRDYGFINDLPIVSLTCGSMGKKKTTIITDMALSQEIIFRNKAFELLQKNDMKFPNFPWISLELDIRKGMQDKTIYNLVSIKDWFKSKRQAFEDNMVPENVYGYDFKQYGLTFYDNLVVQDLFDVLQTYAQLYFIYVIESSLIVSNYSMRIDNEFQDEGNFPLWATKFFGNEIMPDSKYSHILDFDTLRLGRKVVEDNKYIGSFEFGVIAITEIGKERGNTLELKEVKKGEDVTNQKNDLFNSWLKMCRHSATVDNFPFIKVFTDEQRPESWGADARDLCEVVTIIGGSEQKLALKWYMFEQDISEWLFNKFIKFYYKKRYERGDNTLLVHLLKSITRALYVRNMKIFNQFGYTEMFVEKERGTLDGEPEHLSYFLFNRKIYSNRFSTDCFSDYFNDLARKTKVGMNDYYTYADVKATIRELKFQNSYFIDGLYKDVDKSS